MTFLQNYAFTHNNIRLVKILGIGMSKLLDNHK